MPRPQRCRRVCAEPQFLCFLPDGVEEPEEIVLSVDEYEVLRLVDYEKKSHEQCAVVMDISRTTVTEIYEKARYKIAECLVRGKTAQHIRRQLQNLSGTKILRWTAMQKENLL